MLINELHKSAPSNLLFAGPKLAIPSGQDGPILPARVANQNTGFTSSCPLAEPYNKYALLTKCEVMMAGYWPSSFFCIFIDRDEVEAHKNVKKE